MQAFETKYTIFERRWQNGKREAEQSERSSETARRRRRNGEAGDGKRPKRTGQACLASPME